MSSDEKKFKEGVFGALKRPKATGKFVPNYESVSNPLVQSDAVVRAGCTGCGYLLELTRAGAERLANLAGVQVPASWDGQFFQSDRCPLCGNEYTNVLLRKIGDLL